MFIIKGVVSGHYSHISQFTYKCIMWTVIINEDEEGRYVYRSEIWQALKFDFHSSGNTDVRGKSCSIMSVRGKITCP